MDWARIPTRIGPVHCGLYSSLTSKPAACDSTGMSAVVAHWMNCGKYHIQQYPNRGFLDFLIKWVFISNKLTNLDNPWQV